MKVPRSTAEIRRTVLVQCPEIPGTNGVYTPDHEILFDEVNKLEGFGVLEGPLINGIIAVGLEHAEPLPYTDDEMMEHVLDAVDRAFKRTKP